MSDGDTTPPAELIDERYAAPEAGPSFWQRALAALKGLTPARVVLYVTVLANLTAALVPVVTDAGYEQLVAPLLGVNAMAAMFLRGWHAWEKAQYDAEKMQYIASREDVARAEQAAAVAAAQRPRPFPR